MTHSADQTKALATRRLPGGSSSPTQSDRIARTVLWRNAPRSRHLFGVRFLLPICDNAVNYRLSRRSFRAELRVFCRGCGAGASSSRCLCQPIYSRCISSDLTPARANWRRPKFRPSPPSAAGPCNGAAWRLSPLQKKEVRMRTCVAGMR